MPGKEKLLIDLWKRAYFETKTPNITSIPNKFKPFIKQAYQKGWTNKINNKKDQNNYYRAERRQGLGKTT